MRPRRLSVVMSAAFLAVVALGGCDHRPPAPTAAPTAGPTISPTTSPTVEPTVEPTAEPTAEPTVEPTVEPTAAPTGPLYLNPDTQAYQAWQAASGDEQALLAKIAQTPQAFWVGDWYDASSITSVVSDYTGRAVAADAVPTLAIYAIPGRDCGQYSAGGVATSEYAQWIDAVAAGIQGEPIVVLEPDALADLGACDGQGDRVGYLQYAAEALTGAGGRVYIDIGHSKWLPVEEAVGRLEQVGLEHAAGFALNTSNYQTTADEQAYGEAIVAALGGDVGFVIDTSRNGNGSNGEWCNPRGRALGDRPTLVDDATHLDALLWVKLPGESDGTCNGGPEAGQWWQEIALEMARNAAW
jgi:endoglucanase